MPLTRLQARDSLAEGGQPGPARSASNIPDTILENQNSSFQSSSSNTNPSSDINSTPELNILISSIVRQVFDSEGRNLVQNLLNPYHDQFQGNDQIISVDQRNKLEDLDKIPDVVRCLRTFSGDPQEFNSWKKSVERILQIYEPIKGSAKYYGILNVIRNKIIGRADAALESYNTPLNWPSISRCLIMHYADKRDLTTLEYQMTSLIQGNSTVQEFYQTVYSHLSLILNRISCMDISGESLALFTQTYRDKALDTFIRGLKGDLPRLLGIREPVDLPQALHLCLKLDNQNFRSNYAMNAQGTLKKVQVLSPPHFSSRRLQQPHVAGNKTAFEQQPNYDRQLYYNNQRPVQYQGRFNPQPFYSAPQNNAYQSQTYNQTYVPQFRSNYNNFQSGPRPTFTPRAQPLFTQKPVKLESRENMQSLQTRTKFAQRSQQLPTSNNIQPNFHINATQEDMNNYNQEIEDNLIPEETLVDYIQPGTEEVLEICDDFEELNFLD